MNGINVLINYDSILTHISLTDVFEAQGEDGPWTVRVYGFKDGSILLGDEYIAGAIYIGEAVIDKNDLEILYSKQTDV